MTLEDFERAKYGKLYAVCRHSSNFFPPCCHALYNAGMTWHIGHQ